jgi:drug/metabolite transporter (DMT)-like permease
LVRTRFGSVLYPAIAVLLGALGSFVLTTVVMDTVADSVLVGISCATAFVTVAAPQGRLGLAELRRADRGALGVAAIGGALAFWAAPLLALSQRASDAPSGADTLFLTTSVWALVCVAAAFAVRAERPPVTALAGAAAAVAGAAGLLASWESPSSFSPFAKFPAREALMLLAGLMFAAGALALAEAARRAGARVATAAGLGGAAVLGVAGALLALPSAGGLVPGALLPCVYLGVAVAVFAAGWVRTTAAMGVSRAAAILLVVPAAVMAFSAIERVTTVRGPNPIAWGGAVAGSAVVVVSAGVVWLAARGVEGGPVRTSRALWAALGLAGGSCVLAVASLATPALSAVAEGGTGTPFHAAWTMVGAESATGWIVLAAAGLALAAVMVVRRGGPTSAWAPAAMAVVVCGAAAIALIGTTIHTWNSWVPAEVQQTYGTEYARLVIEPHLDPVRTAAMVLALCAVIVLAVFAKRSGATNHVSTEESQ